MLVAVTINLLLLALIVVLWLWIRVMGKYGKLKSEYEKVKHNKRVIARGKIGLVPGNVIVKVPEGYLLLISPRSSLPRKKGLVCPHSIGIIDQDYHGAEDEILIQVQNVSQEPVTVERGERIAQGLFVRVDRAEWKEVENHGAQTRGGFGSTGTHREEKKETATVK